MNRNQRRKAFENYLSEKVYANNIEKYCEEAMPYLYSAMALVLHRRGGWDEDTLGELFKDIDAVWNECCDSGNWNTMLKKCYDEAGIVLIHKDVALREGIIK